MHINRFVIVAVLLFFSNVSAQAIDLASSASFVLRGTTCGEVPNYPSLYSSWSSLNATTGRLAVPESSLTAYLGDLTLMEGEGATIPATDIVFSVGQTLDQDVGLNAANLNYRIHIAGLGEHNFVDTDATVVEYLRQKWFVEQETWSVEELAWLGDPATYSGGLTGLQTDWVKNTINYLRGRHELEQDSAGPYRNRKYPVSGGGQAPWVLGEIFSKPIFVFPPRLTQTALSYPQFAQAQANRPAVLLFGAGDGMIHAVYTDGPDSSLKGHQIYSFIPNSVVSQLGLYARPDYTRQAFVEGPIDAFDVYDGTQWRTMLLAALGHGGKSIVGLDITDPLNPVFRFEFTHSNLGYSYSRVVAGRFLDPSGPGRKDYFVTGGGFKNSDGRAYVLVFDVNGAVITTIQLPNDADQPSAENGCMSISTFDANGDGITDSIYAGTYHGQLFRIDTSGADPVSWSSALLIADFSPRSITASPRILRQDSKNLIVAGTGKLLSALDIDDTTLQYFTAFEESGSSILLSNLDVYASSWANGPPPDSRRFVQLTLVQNVNQEKGFALQLPDQHKFVNSAIPFADALLFTTVDPKIEEGTPCTAPSGKSVLWLVAQKGNPAFRNEPNIDINADQITDAQDLINGKAVAGMELNSATYEALPQIDFKQTGLRLHAVAFYSTQVINNTIHAQLETITIKNRFKFHSRDWNRSLTAK